MTAPGLIHVGLVNAAQQDASSRRAPHWPPPSRGGPPRRRTRGAIASVLARAATRFDAESAKRIIA